MMTANILDQFDLSPEQRQAALARGCDVVVTAGAGTGKTRTLVARYVSLLDDGAGATGDDSPGLRGVVAVTFTRKAAREMRSRVRREIGAYLARPELDERAAARWLCLRRLKRAASKGVRFAARGRPAWSHPLTTLKLDLRRSSGSSVTLSRMHGDAGRSRCHFLA
jgi:ATP-dependent exoDNAse (exonuclease V) beta subunit